MKMLTIRKILTLAAFAFAHLIISCSNIADREEEFKAVVTAEQSKSECAYIRVNVENIDSGSRTLLPKVEISNLVLTGKRGSSETQVLASADTLAEMSAKQIELQTESNTETWKFTLTAKVSGVAYSSGEVSKEIKSGGENPLTFTLEPADGKTTGDLIFSINPIGTEGVEYEAILKIDDAEEPRYSFKNGETSPNWSLSLEAGTHTLTVEFYAKNANNQTDPTDPSLPKNSNSECLNIYKSIVRIEKGITTRAEIKNFNLNQVYTISYEGYEPTVKEGVPVADTLDPVNTVMTLKFSRKGGDIDGYIALPKLSNSTMTFSGWYTSADFAEASKVPESGTAPNTVQKIKVRENLKDLKLYAKWLVEATGSITTPSDYNFVIALKTSAGKDAKFFKSGATTTFTINPTITPAVDVNDVTWAASLWCGNSKVCELPPVISGSNITVTIPESVKFEDTYVLKISATYLGIAHDASFILTGGSVPSVASLTQAPTAENYPELTISTSAEFDKLQEWSNTVDFEGITITLQDDVTVSDDLAIRQFKGTFDGNNKSITQNVITDTTYSSDKFTLANGKTISKSYMTLFMSISGDAVIKNLTTKGNGKSGGIVGLLNSGTIENCISETTLSSKKQGGRYLGGIVSTMHGGVVRNCINKGELIPNRSGTGTVYAGGGIAGSMFGGTGIIENCINYGNIGTSGSWYIGFAGGIVGYLQGGTIKNSKNKGNVRGVATGGLVGSFDGDTYIYNCSNNGSMQKVPSSDISSTGLPAGLIASPYARNAKIIVNNCNSGEAEVGIFNKMGGYSYDEKPTGFSNNYSITGDSPLPQVLIGGIGSDITKFTADYFTEAEFKFFTDSNEARTALNDWVNTQNQLAGETIYNSWKLDSNNRPELDLGELDNK